MNVLTSLPALIVGTPWRLRRGKLLPPPLPMVQQQ